VLACSDLAEEENDNSKKERLDKLAGFQLSMIRVRYSAEPGVEVSNADFMHPSSPACDEV
jgi:hypothetical protein